MSERPVTIGLLWHSANSANLGVGALSVSQIAIIEKVAREIGVAPRFLIIGWKDPLPVYINAPNVEMRDLRTRDLVRPVGGLYTIARECDVVLDIGAGDSFADIYGVARALKILISKYVVLASGRPLVLSPQTIGPFKRPWARWMARYVMNRAKMVLTRDSLSTAFLKELGYTGPAEEATDVALRLPYDPPAKREDGVVRVGLNASGLLMSGGYTKDNMFGLTVDYPKLVRAAVAWFQAQPNCEVHLVSHVNATDMPVEDDYAAAEALAAEFPGAVLVPRFASPSAAKSYIAGLDFFTGSRMHACIAAFSSGVPVVPMAYSRKFSGLFGTLGYDRVADCKSESEEAILAKLREGYAERATLSAEIATSREDGERRLARYEAVLREVLSEAAR